MDERQLEDLRLLALSKINKAKGYAVDLPQILPGLPHHLRTMPASDIEFEMDYMVQKGWLERVKKESAPSVKRWRITAAGGDYLAEEGME